nr:hypothetical protein BaRGS_025289 [Batillaria attramentaria]
MDRLLKEVEKTNARLLDEKGVPRREKTLGHFELLVDALFDASLACLNDIAFDLAAESIPTRDTDETEDESLIVPDINVMKELRKKRSVQAGQGEDKKQPDVREEIRQLPEVDEKGRRAKYAKADDTMNATNKAKERSSDQNVNSLQDIVKMQRRVRRAEDLMEDLLKHRRSRETRVKTKVVEDADEEDLKIITQRGKAPPVNPKNDIEGDVIENIELPNLFGDEEEEESSTKSTLFKKRSTMTTTKTTTTMTTTTEGGELPMISLTSTLMITMTTTMI